MNPVFRRSQILEDLSACAVGDVLCLRAFAEGLLGEQDPESPLRRDARLILIAACLHLQASVAVAPSLSGLAELLTNIVGGLAPPAAWGSSPVLFLQYAAAELAALAPDAVAGALAMSLRACEQHRKTILIRNNEGN